ncbi:hypothetical protein EJ04DRAFT_183389 [Polyplosphaeria fusca]|uniref:Uncharacterized protein n=1 Tax=Polyplosphaeria fusca TaxID=682080 RepID=A0A9P4UV88_9PLEO|nr:hypothetical protein EJ04DRAFT_183389 [Polyplosphaeria fusca]
MISLIAILSTLLVFLTLTSALPTNDPIVLNHNFPRANGDGSYPSTYTGAIYGYGYIDVHSPTTRSRLGCLDDQAKFIAQGTCAEYWIWNWEFEVMNSTTHGSNGLVSFEDANRDKFFPQPSTQNVLWVYTIARSNWVTDFWMMNGLVTANDATNGRNNASIFYVEKIPQGTEQVNVTIAEQETPITWVWKPNCERKSRTMFCGDNV